jgi:hypothetical protein
MAAVGLQRELECIRKEREQFDQEHVCILENERIIGEELKTKNRELASKIKVIEWSKSIYPRINL